VKPRISVRQKHYCINDILTGLHYVESRFESA